MPPFNAPDAQAPGPESDQDLVARLWSGQTDALAVLYDRYAQMVCTLALRILTTAAV